jgi:O-antigen ligase
VQQGQVLIASDQLRIQAWGAAVAMWQANPLVGHGFLSYKQLGEAYGDPILGSPHNEWLRLFAEEGTVVGLIALAFIAVGLLALSRLPGWRGTALMASWAAIVLAASFNNPFLFLQVSVISFAIVGTGLALTAQSRSLAVVSNTYDRLLAT